MAIISPCVSQEEHTGHFAMFFNQINWSQQDCSSLLISKESCWYCLNLEITLQSKKWLGKPQLLEKHSQYEQVDFFLLTSQSTCLPLIFVGTPRQRKTHLTATSSWEDLLSNRPTPHRRPKFGGLHCQSHRATTLPDCISALYYRNYGTTQRILTAQVLFLPRIVYLTS